MTDFIYKIFLYSQEHPLIFTQFFFWAFYAIVLFVYTFIANKRIIRSLFILIASLFFYYKSSGFFFFLLIFSTLVDYYIGKYIYQSKKELVKKLLLALSVTINLGVLAYFKYAYFFTEAFNQMFHSKYEVINWLALWSNNLTGTHFDVDTILLPVGISFFTFQTISYTIDVYRGLVKPVKNIIDFGFYVSFFPQLVAGPIVRAASFIPQIYEKFHLTKHEFGLALFMILKGLVKKIFIGDYIAVNFVDRVFGNPVSYTGFENLFGLIGYSLQVYVDFSGYTDIAIGVALLMGFRLPKNFDSPYKALNTGEFWRRWHISLSSWLKDYLYIPLGGNRKATVGTYAGLGVILAVIVLLSNNLILIPVFAGCIIIIIIISWLYKPFRNHIESNINRMITMLLGGLWHGASWNFILWGGINGLGVVIYKYWRKISPWENSNKWIVRAWRILLTFSFITFTRVFFRGESYEKSVIMLKKIWNEIDISLIPDIVYSYKYVFLMMGFGFLTHWLSYNFKDKMRDKFIASPVWVKVLTSVVVIFIIYQSISADMQPFIYFQF